MYISPQDRVKHHLGVHSKGLYDTISTLHEACEFRPRKTFQMIRDSFECGGLESIGWCKGRKILPVLDQAKPSKAPSPYSNRTLHLSGARVRQVQEVCSETSK